MFLYPSIKNINHPPKDHSMHQNDIFSYVCIYVILALATSINKGRIISE